MITEIKMYGCKCDNCGKVDIKRFQALKAAYDGIGHEKGKMTKGNRTEITKVNAADDSALFTKSILLSFPKRDTNNPFTDVETKNLNEIRGIEKGGWRVGSGDKLKDRILI